MGFESFFWGFCSGFFLLLGVWNYAHAVAKNLRKPGGVLVFKALGLLFLGAALLRGGHPSLGQLALFLFSVVSGGVAAFGVRILVSPKGLR